MVGGAVGPCHPGPAGKPGPQKCSRFDTEGSVGPSGAQGGMVLAPSTPRPGRVRAACHRPYFFPALRPTQRADLRPRGARRGPRQAGPGRPAAWGAGSGGSDLVRPAWPPGPGRARGPRPGRAAAGSGPPAPRRPDHRPGPPGARRAPPAGLRPRLLPPSAAPPRSLRRAGSQPPRAGVAGGPAHPLPAGKASRKDTATFVTAARAGPAARSALGSRPAPRRARGLPGLRVPAGPVTGRTLKVLLPDCGGTPVCARQPTTRAAPSGPLGQPVPSALAPLRACPGRALSRRTGCGLGPLPVGPSVGGPPPATPGRPRPAFPRAGGRRSASPRARAVLVRLLPGRLPTAPLPASLRRSRPAFPRAGGRRSASPRARAVPVRLPVGRLPPVPSPAGPGRSWSARSRAVCQRPPRPPPPPGGPGPPSLGPRATGRLPPAGPGAGARPAPARTQFVQQLFRPRRRPERGGPRPALGRRRNLQVGCPSPSAVGEAAGGAGCEEGTPRPPETRPSTARANPSDRKV